MMDTCSHRSCSIEGCDGRVVCVVQDFVVHYHHGKGRDVTRNDGPPKGLCSKHSRKYNKRRGAPIGQPDEIPETKELPF